MVILKKHKDKTNGEFVFGIFNYLIMLVLVLVTVYPLLYVFSASVSDANSVTQGLVWLLPVKPTLYAYKLILNDSQIWIAYANTIFYAFVGTFAALLITACGAYPLSRKSFLGQRFVNMLVLLTMWFNAGIIPFYINLRNLNMLNKRGTLIIAFACSAFYVVLMRSYYQSIPDTLEESAKLDGANDLQVLTQIYLPLSKPALATVGLYYFVERWNSYFWAMTIMTDTNKVPLQVLLRKIVVQMKVASDVSDIMLANTETVIYATIVVAVLPMLLLYPFIQKFFVKGIMLGAVKG